MVKVVLFDIDGTLIDSLESNFLFFKKLMEVAGYPPPTREEYVPIFHKPTWDVIPILTGVHDEKEIKRIWDLAHDPAVKVMPPIVNEGVEETIALLSKEYPLGIVTSRIKTHLYEPPLDTLKRYISVTVAYEDTKEHKPHPEPLLSAAIQFNVSPEECVYIGDAETDRDAARAAGMRFVFYNRVNGKLLDGSDAVANHFRDIPAVLKTL